MNLNNVEKKDTRSGFGDGLFELGEQNPKIAALCADLTGSLKMSKFANKFADRFFQVGIAEANMMGIAAGLATAGMIPFTGTFANFSTGRVYDQIRQSIAYSNKNVKICASHAGITLGEDGATHQILEDIGLMKMLPGMVVINPCDYLQTKKATIAIATYNGPVYLRFGRPAVPMFTQNEDPFVIGKAWKIKEGKDITLCVTGHMVWEGIMAAEELSKVGIEVDLINIHTIKPLDNEPIINSVAKTGALVSAEEHNVMGGMGESIASLLSQKFPVPLKIIGTQDTFGESGKPYELMEKYGLTKADIIKAIKTLIKHKK